MGLVAWLVSGSVFSNPTVFSPTGAGGGGGWATSFHSDCMCVRICVCVEGAKGDYIMRGCIVQRNLEKGGGGGGVCVKVPGDRVTMGPEERV